MKYLSAVLLITLIYTGCGPAFTVTDRGGSKQNVEYITVKASNRFELYDGGAFRYLKPSAVHKMVLDHKTKKNINSSLYISCVISPSGDINTNDSVWVNADNILEGKANSGDYSIPLTEVKVLIQN